MNTTNTANLEALAAADRRKSLDAIGRVISYIARNWYDYEFGKVEAKDRWYGPALRLMEDHAQAVARRG